MLVLSRKKSEKIMIGDNIWIQVVEINSGFVKIGIEAPKDVEVHRQEVYEDIKLGVRPKLAPRIPCAVR